LKEEAGGGFALRPALLLGDASLGAEDLLLDLASRIAQTAVAGREQPRIDSAVVFDRANAAGGQSHRDGLVQNFRRKRANLQIGLPTTTRLVVRVADIITKERLFAADGAYTGHNHLAGQKPRPSQKIKQSAVYRGSDGGKSSISAKLTNIRKKPYPRSENSSFSPKKLMIVPTVLSIICRQR